MREQLRALRVVLRVSAAADRRLLWTTFVLALLNVAIWTCLMFVMRALTDAVVSGDANAGIPSIVLLGALMAAWPVWWRSMASSTTTLHERTSHEFDRRLIADGVTCPGLEQHESVEYLDQLALLRTQMRELGNPVAMAELLGASSLLAISIALLASVDPLCAALPCFAVPCVLLTTRVERSRVAAESDVAAAQRLRQRLFVLLTDPGPAKESKVLGLGEQLRHRHRQAWAASIRAGDRVDLLGAAMTSAGWAIFTLGLTGALWVLVWGASRGTVSAGDVMLFVLISQALTAQVGDVLHAFARLQRTLSAAQRYRWVAAFAQRARERSRPLRPVAVPARITQGISLEDVTFAYPGHAAAALSDVSLVLPAGGTVALVGENGAGKTTLVKLLCRLYEPSRGRIALDRQDLSAFELDEWRACVSAGFQDFARFELALRESVGVGDLARLGDAASIRRALEAADAGTLEQRLPRGLETQLGSRWPAGAELSGGQWQRVALARSFMRQAPLLLVLDEPTASLDAATEHRLFSRFAAAARATSANGGITLFVAHRLSTVRAADLIVVLDGGRIAEQGDHDALVHAGGTYAELYELQARAYRGTSPARS